MNEQQETVEMDAEELRRLLEEPVEATATPEPEAQAALDPERARELLEGVLEHLGAAHHRPFSAT